MNDPLQLDISPEDYLRVARPGYRWVDEGETLLLTDEIFRDGQWRLTKDHGKRCCFPFEFQRRIDDE